MGWKGSGNPWARGLALQTLCSGLSGHELLGQAVESDSDRRRSSN